MGNIVFRLELATACIFMFGTLMFIVSPWTAASLSAIFLAVSLLAFKHISDYPIVGWVFLLAFVIALVVAGFQERDSLRKLPGEEQTRSRRWS